MIDRIIYESGEGLEEDERDFYEKNLKKTLSNFGICQNTLISCQDQSQNFKLQLLINDQIVDDESQPFRIAGEANKEAQISKKDVSTVSSSNATSISKKRKREEDDQTPKPEVSQNNKSTTIVIDLDQDERHKRQKIDHNNNNNNILTIELD